MNKRDQETTEFDVEQINVLHVDDDVFFLEFVKIYLEDMFGNLRVDILSCPEKTFQKIKENDYDVIVSDYQMPALNGLELLEQLRKRGNEISFIIFTGKGREEVAINALNLGADYYLQKGSPEVSFAELNHFITISARKKKEREHRLRIERKLRESEERFRKMADNIPGGLTIIERGKVVYVNEHLCEITGYTRKELLETTTSSLAVSWEKERLKRRVKKWQQANTIPDDLIFWIVHKNGSRRCIHNRYFFSKRENEVLDQYVITTDLTDYKRAELALEESEQNLRTFINTISDFFIVLDEQGTIQQVNNTVIKRLEYFEEELIDKPVLKVHPPERREETRRLIQEMLDGETKLYSVPLMAKDGEYISVETRIVKCKWKGKDMLFCISKDMSELRTSKACFFLRKSCSFCEFAKGVCSNHDFLLEIIEC
ncbi:MAG: PAS domain S-box protein [Candidatus Hodarchaeales archaeon]|jgi:PAS domain S-box-containing protein